MAWRRLLGLWDNEQSGGKNLPGLAEVVDQARRDWLYAQNYYNSVTDTDLIDYAIYLSKACERRYMYLLRQARQEGVRYPLGANLAEFSDTGTIRRVL